MQKEIKHTWFFRQSPQEVWEYLTKPKLLEQWLMKNNFQPIVGCDFQFNTNPAPQIDFDGTVYCKVLEIVPNKKLVYSWKCGPGNGKITIDSLVTWTLLPKENGTELILENTGFKIMENFTLFSAMEKGWLEHMKLIYKNINGTEYGTTKA